MSAGYLELEQLKTDEIAQKKKINKASICLRK